MGHPEYVASNVVTLTREPEPVGGWLSVDTSDKHAATVRDRVGKHLSTTLEGSSKDTRRNLAFSRLLSDDQLQMVYQRVPDVRAAIDSIVRRIATWDWFIKPAVHPSDERYEEALAAAETARRFLQAPNHDGETWQELMTKMVSDLLVYDAGVIENVYDGVELPDGTMAPGNSLEEFVALRGSEIVPVIDDFGRTLAYQQRRYDATTVIAEPVSINPDRTENPVFMPRQIVLFRLFPSTATTTGQPLIESVVNEVISMMRQSEHSMLAFDADEIPPGILVITGVSGAAAEAAKQELRRMRGKDHKVRVVTSPDPAATGARWVELRHTAKDVDFVNVVSEIRRTVWRVFGVLPVEMGSSEDVPRAVGQVQLDVSSSHLISPILELIEGKVNARMLPLILDKETAHLVNFRFDREFKLTAAEQKAKSDALRSLVSAGVLTRNEARAELDLPPIKGGDTVLIETPIGPMPLQKVVDGTSPVGEVGTVGGDEGDDGDDTPPAPSGGGATGEVDDPTAGSPSADDDAPGEMTSIRYRAALDLPSEWQPRGMFKDVRTIDLPRLGELVSLYSRVVAPLYDEAEREVLSIVAQRYTADYNEEDAIALLNEVSAALDKLAVQWGMSTAGLYREAAKIGRDGAANWTGAQVADNYDDVAEVYRQKAMSYLVSQGGLIADLKLSITEILMAPFSRSRLQIRVEVDEDGFPIEAPAAKNPRSEIVGRVSAAFAAMFFRIQNWGGRLVELANDVLSSGMTEASSVEDEGVQTATNWWCEWVNVGDERMCETCETLGEGDVQGYWRLSDLPTRPGGDTECRARCRCVLVLWTKEEITSGEAVRLNTVSAR